MHEWVWVCECVCEYLMAASLLLLPWYQAFNTESPWPSGSLNCATAESYPRSESRVCHCVAILSEYNEKMLFLKCELVLLYLRVWCVGANKEHRHGSFTCIGRRFKCCHWYLVSQAKLTMMKMTFKVMSEKWLEEHCVGKENWAINLFAAYLNRIENDVSMPTAVSRLLQQHALNHFIHHQKDRRLRHPLCGWWIPA